jgi:hypothetical protein
MFDVNNRITDLEERLKAAKWLADHRLKGIRYWQGKAL